MRSLLVDYEARSEVLACDLMPGGGAMPESTFR